MNGIAGFLKYIYISLFRYVKNKWPIKALREFRAAAMQFHLKMVPRIEKLSAPRENERKKGKKKD